MIVGVSPAMCLTMFNEPVSAHKCFVYFIFHFLSLCECVQICWWILVIDMICDDGMMTGVTLSVYSFLKILHLTNIMEWEVCLHKNIQVKNQLNISFIFSRVRVLHVGIGIINLAADLSLKML